MNQSPLHITNGDSLTQFLDELNIKGEKLTWREMLCEGPTIETIDCDDFFDLRKSFLKDHYNVSSSEYSLNYQLKLLKDISSYSEIVLWFEYDLFCHINMLAAISLIKQKQIELPVYLVCSGTIEGSSELKGLSELSDEELLEHYSNKIRLPGVAIDIAETLWGIYCGRDHNLFKPYLTMPSVFKYLSPCLKAHFERFPNPVSGLSKLENHILKLANNEEIKTKNQLLGYAMNYQGYYGFGDVQVQRLIDNLDIFFYENGAGLTLNRDGHEALLKHHNVSGMAKNQMMYGGVERLDFQYHEKESILIKTNNNGI
ncbi:DUF1835 domain-containing protein [Mangrovimonas aestuarii]|uniref:DUF1835 domain-containing protein n=1 Tax=Mangrovimonas aestuarii TaxID=3018443 RepID=UPI002378E509|nr:DUF1835 domain-containing protein [Mangrovimonas aestuarii]